MAKSLEERFTAFLTGLPGAEAIDTAIPEQTLGRHQRADFLLRNRQIVLELKTLTNNPERKIEERLGRHRERPEFPVFYWDSDLNEILGYLPDGEAVRHEIFHALTRAVQGAFESADDQVNDTKMALGLADACGVLAILNEQVTALSPDMIVAKANQMLLKRTKEGDIRYRNIAYVWVVSEAHEIVGPDSVEQLPILLLEGPMAETCPEIGDYISTLNAEWAAIEGVPLRSSVRLENFKGTTFADRKPKPEPAKAPPGMIRRQDLWERNYERKPYLRSLSEQAFLMHMARIFETMKPHFLKNGRKFSEQAIREFMRGWADVMVEARHRRLDMKKLRPYLEREISAKKTPESA